MKNTVLVLSGLLAALSVMSSSVNAAEEYRLGSECLPMNPATAGYSRVYGNEANNQSLTTDLVVVCPVTGYFPKANHTGFIKVYNGTGRPLTCTRTIYGSDFGRGRIDTLTTTVSATLTFPAISGYSVILGIGYRCTLPYKGSFNNSAEISGYMSNHY